MTNLLRPPRLKKGDRVRIVSMSGTFPKNSWEFGRNFAEALGLKASIGASMSRDPGYIGRDPRRRADDFNDAVRDDSVRAILLFRGGNSAAEVLRHLDYAALRRSPKVVAGYSDHSSVVAAVHAQAGLTCFLVPPALQQPPGRRQLTVDSFRALAFEAAQDLAMPALAQETWAPGRARGRLVAGNLAILRNLLGTPYLPSLQGALLAWEEIGESIQDINMILTQLANAGAFDGLKGMVVGHLEGVPRSEDGYTVRDLIRWRFAGPVLKSKAFGHFRPCFALPLGVQAELDARTGLQLLEPAVS